MGAGSRQPGIEFSPSVKVHLRISLCLVPHCTVGSGNSSLRMRIQCEILSEGLRMELGANSKAP